MKKKPWIVKCHPSQKSLNAFANTVYAYEKNISDLKNGALYAAAKIMEQNAFREMNEARRKIVAAFEEVAAIKFPIDEE